MSYVGRFAPSPSGALHAGSLVAALASFLDARVHGGQWLLRIEDVDEARTVPGSAEDIMRTLRVLGMQWDGEVVWQSQRKALYQQACDQLGQHVFPCACTRREIADSHTGIASDGAPVYPGTCRAGLPAGRASRALRVRVPAAGDPASRIQFHDRWFGDVSQDLAAQVGDFVLRRADGYWAYQLAVVVDDAAQGVTDVVRGADLLDSTPRQIWLQRLLGLPTPTYLHVPTVTNAQGEKLSKQTGAMALDLGDPLQPLKRAAAFLGLAATEEAATAARFWAVAATGWEQRLREREQATKA
ncbi:tRNA glutamyl-Q(34) synthetase GluQRS [Lacisediminimonas profundi]|uniref:tRNA glutamyl-Q(34) synthetase GluQRS n=1 Tax=Lacisediminimonas profundi TaxID=2603856 RepID=UPI00124AFC3A|nr:tRNA glutamyl-Q(34) synthetase GluQRS [Lacisediminimonas profundi]